MNKNIILLAAAITAFSSFAGLSWTENFDISKFSINTETIYGTEYSIVNYDDLSKDGAIGMPLLPVEYLRFSVPYNAVNFSLTYTEAAPITISIEAPVEIGQDEYLEQGEPQSFTGVFPVNIAEIINVGYIAGEHKVVTIGLHPVTTNTQSNSISVRSAISINLAWQLKDDLSNEPLQPIFSNFSLPSGDYGFDTSILVNPEDIAANMAPHQNARVANDEEYPYIIITPQRLVKPLERLAALRRVKGYNCKVFVKIPNRSAKTLS